MTLCRTEAASNFRRVLRSGFRKRSVELRTRNERLIEADRAKNNFIATVSHELRTPLNTITGWTQLLQSGALPADRIAHGLAVIARNAQAQVQIVDDLLDVSRMASGKVTLDIESVDLPSLVHAVLDAREMLLQLLGECGAAVFPAGSAAEALEIIRSQQIDVVVSDIGMADVDGLQLIREIRKLPGAARTLPAVARTAYTRAVDRTRALQAGFQATSPGRSTPASSSP